MIAAAALAAAALVVVVGWRWRPRPAARSSSPAAHRTRTGAAPDLFGWRPWQGRRPTAVAVADYLAAVARELRAGGTVTAAFLAVTPTLPGGAALLGAWRAAADGLPLVEALERAAAGGRRHPDPAVDVAVHSLSCAAAVGGSAAASIDAAAAVLRERDAVAADARVQSAQARLSGRVLTIVPIGFAMWSAATDERIRRAAFSTSVGAAAVVAGLLLNAAGWWWMHRIVDGGGSR